MRSSSPDANLDARAALPPSEHDRHVVLLPVDGIVGRRVIEPDRQHVLLDLRMVEPLPPPSARMTRSMCTRIEITRATRMKSGVYFGQCTGQLSKIIRPMCVPA